MEELKSLVPPPENPVNTGSAAAWASVIDEIDQDLPRELFLLNSVYGSGHFVGGEFWLEIHSVFRPSFALMVEFNSRVFSREAVHSPDPYSDLFELGAYGVGDDAGSLGRIFWDTSGRCDQWKVGLSRPLQRFSMSLVEFLAAWVSRRIKPRGFPDDIPAIEFIPWESPNFNASGP